MPLRVTPSTSACRSSATERAGERRRSSARASRCPEGVSVSPSSADGLQACSDAQFAVDSTEPASCPLASQVATVTAKTPVLSEPVVGQVFVGSPDCSPCSEADAQEGRMVRLLMQVQIPGTSLKFPGSVSVDPATDA